MFAKLLIANRGEIACRIIRTAREMGILTVAVHSDVDANALHVRLADEAVSLGGAAPSESYLRAGRILALAKEAKADAIHPGYGFLSENADFAQMTADAGMVFVGPPPHAIREMGSKDRAKEIMLEAGVPVVPGYHGSNQDAAFLKRKAYEIGYPVLIKAVAGGGGKGMRRVDKALDFDGALDAARREAASSFGNDDVLIERFVATPRHIEMQVFADSHGNVVHLGERDCSMQRRHQKVIEEAPAPGMTDELRAIMGKAACEAARAVGYEGAGTVEFIVDASDGLREDGFFFMEMNTRLQVEHPVTEMVTGVDLVEWQLRVANGEKLPLTQDEIELTGHAVEARIYAEDPSNDFLPAVGKLAAMEIDGVRIDTGVEAGDTISPYYDPMIAKAIAFGQTRDQSFDSLQNALSESRFAGLKTNIAFLVRLIGHSDLRKGAFDTGLIDGDLAALTKQAEPSAEIIATGIAALIAAENRRIYRAAQVSGPWHATDGFQLYGERIQEYPCLVDGEPCIVKIAFGAGGIALVEGENRIAANSAAKTICADDGTVYVIHKGRQFAFEHALTDATAEVGKGGAVRAPMTGKVVGLSVAEGDEVEQGDILFAVEAMKMEHAVTAQADGIVRDLAIAIGDQVDGKTVAMTIEVAGDAG